MKERFEIPVYTWFLVGALLFSVFTFLLGIWVCAHAPRDDQSMRSPVPVIRETGESVSSVESEDIYDTDVTEMPDPMAEQQESAGMTPEVQPPRKPEPARSDTPQVRDQQETAKPVKAEPKPATAAPADTGAKTFYIQLTATPVEKSAQELKQRFERKGYNVYLVEATQNGQKLYKVRIGVFNSRQQASTIAEKIRKEDKIKPWIVAM